MYCYQHGGMATLRYYFTLNHYKNMKQLLALLTLTISFSAMACKKSSTAPDDAGSPRTETPVELHGSWMYGNFSMTEYWSQYPGDYLGNALEFAIAFKFEADGHYTQYFTSKSYMAGVTTYHQSVSKGTATFDAASHRFKTYPITAHYKRTANGKVAEDRDLAKSELSGVTSYSYTTGNESGGTPAIYLTLQNTTDPLTFLKR